eukprot:m.227876 g.227876  ORF g.227876 m.227876 type:complete len:716 (-) comp11660_c0_seq1:70-2217(-)
MPRMDQLIPVVNKLQDVFHTVGDRDVIQLPQIVVVGAQSSGKSSVLENIVGRDFLPRGTGIVTRVPLIMQLIQRTGAPRPNEPKEEEWAQFLHCPDRVFVDFDEVRQEIENRTVALVGDSKNVSDKPIHLKVFSPHVLNLTLVDLPGITKVPVAGQPKDIEKQIRELVLQYINNPNSIILAVSPANADLANSDAIKIAQEVDPSGDRTIGVITKLDLMDRGTDATDVLLGKVIPVKLGLIGVVNRSQYDIDHKKNMKDAAKAEAEFFTANYPTLAHRCGVPFLARTLNKVLMLHIRRCLPDLKQRIRGLLNRTQQAMHGFGAPLASSDHGAMLLQVLTKFSESYRASINGTSMDLQTSELSGGARIFHIFKNVFGRELESLDPLQGLEAEHILTAIRNASGTRSSLFIPESSFEFLVKRQVARLENPALRCIELVSEELERLINLCIFPELHRFRELRDRIVQTTNSLLHSRTDPTTKMVENLIAIEVAYINTTHPDFEGAMAALQSGHPEVEPAVPARPVQALPVPAKEAPKLSSTPTPQEQLPGADSQGISSSFFPFFGLGGRAAAAKGATDAPVSIIGLPEAMPETTAAPQPRLRMAVSGPVTVTAPTAGLTSKQTREVEMMRQLIAAYFAIARKRIQDTIPKAIMHFMVNYINEQLQNELVRSLYRPDHLGELLQEDPSLAAQRKSTQEMLSALQRASVIITEVSDSDLAF